MRLIINTGKGGVGKTSVSVATARRAAKLGYRTILMSTDSAHSIADSMDMELPPYITNISENFDALEIDIITEMKERWNDIQSYISDFMSSQGVEGLTAEEMAILPGMEMIAALMYVVDFSKNDKYDVIVMDTAPTAETLRLLSFPDISQWYAEKIFSIFKKIMSVARLTVGKLMDMPLPSNDVFKSVETLKNTMDEARVLLEDPKVTTVRLVVNPERMVINETKRAYSYLCLYNKNVECLIVNRVMPKDMKGDYADKKLQEQEKYMEYIHHVFDPMKIFYSELMPTEIVGWDRLDQMADNIFGDSDPTEIYSDKSPISFEKNGDTYYIRMELPFVEKGDLELFRTKDGSVIIMVGSQKRNIALPATLVSAKMVGAELKNEELVISFRREEDE